MRKSPERINWKQIKNAYNKAYRKWCIYYYFDRNSFLQNSRYTNEDSIFKLQDKTDEEIYKLNEEAALNSFKTWVIIHTLDEDFGHLESFFDSHGIYISIKNEVGLIPAFSYFIDSGHDGIKKSENNFEKRNEARTEVINKAFKILEKRL